ncbi:Rieske 2Fe-2S domain-containing protein [Gloeocapsa sp. BRSZ]
MCYVTVATVDDIPPGTTKLVQVEGLPILIVNDRSQFYALQGLCGHQKLSLAKAMVWQGIIDCPWHHFQYDIRTGENVYPRCVYPLEALPHLHQQLQPLRTYPMRIVEQHVQVKIEHELLSNK